jgi:hypothetical protein
MALFVFGDGRTRSSVSVRTMAGDCIMASGCTVGVGGSVLIESNDFFP